MGSTNTYSVVVPAHNSELTIAKCIESISSQTLTASEIILILDDCTDDTKKILKSYVNQKIKIHEVSFKNSAKSRNFGVSKCLYQFIAFLDADDTWEPNKMALQLNSQITANEICATNSLFKNAYGVVFGRNIETKNDEQARKLVRDGIALPAMLSTWVVSRELFKSLNGFDEKLPAAEDFDFAVRAINNGAQFNIVREDLSYYLIHSNSKSVLKRAAQRRIGALIKNNNGNQISKEQISASLDEAIGASEFLSLYSDLFLRKFMITARPNLLQRKYHLLILSFVLSPRRFISKLTKQGL